jgi:beta-galactosidase
MTDESVEFSGINDPSRPRLHIGAAYYPEHWPVSTWVEDIGRMKDLGFSVVRLAEFAWSSLEPASGDYRLDWLEQAIELFGANEIAVVLGTPTAAPPAWLCQKFPDLMAMEENGMRVKFGNRAHYCVNSPDFHLATRDMVSQMARRFAPKPAVIGWQIDNEFSRVCYCQRCLSLFQKHLQHKFENLKELNRRWSTAYWSQTYSAWDQIPLPIGSHNPGLMLEFKRFVTQSYRSFQKLQIETLRPQLKPTDWITHNFMNWFEGLDHYTMTVDLDMASWDWYIGQGHNDHLTTNASHDLARGWKAKNYWVMESQPGMVNWARVNNPLYKGEGRSMAWQAVAHGADGFLYWQWRSAPNAHEQMHGTLVDSSGQIRPFAEEVKRIATEFERASDLVAGSKVKARVAILNDYESRWSLGWQPHHEEFDYVDHLLSYYRPIAAANVMVDIISADVPLDGYKLVIAPATLIMDEQRFNNLRSHVQHGGYLILTPRTAVKDRDNALLPSRPPGPLREMAGVEVAEAYALEEPVPVKGNWFNGVSQRWAELVKLTDVNITVPAARYLPCNGWLDDQPAITVHGYRSGLVYYVGTCLDDKAQNDFLARVLKTCNLNPPFEVPPGVELSRRIREDGTDILFLINHTRERKSVNIMHTYHEHLKDLELAGQVEMAPFGVAVITRVS